MLNLFKFDPGSDRTDLRKGQFINGATSISWTEKYAEAGEFKIVAPLSSGLREFLPIETLISHTNTYEVMFVESHNTKEDPDEDPILEISGRSLEAWLENRIAGAQMARSSNNLSERVLASDYVTSQAIAMWDEDIYSASLDSDKMGLVQMVSRIGAYGDQEERTIPIQDFYTALINLLAVNNIGIKTIRSNPWGVEGNPTYIRFALHKGEDVSSKVLFSSKAGDLDSAEYLWTDKKRKNWALVVGKYLSRRVMIDWGPEYMARRMMIVDGTDLDGHLDTIPTGTQRTNILSRMNTRGKQVLRKQNEIALIRADISEVSQYEFRKDYNIGDIVMVDGNYGEMAKMRVIEYTEILDENELRGHPTLEAPEPED